VSISHELKPVRRKRAVYGPEVILFGLCLLILWLGLSG